MELAKRIDHDKYYYEKPDVVAIDPCTLCAHEEFKRVDSRCNTCKLRGKRFFQVLHAIV